MKKNTILFVVAIFALLFAAGAIGAGYFFVGIFSTAVENFNLVEFTIEPGQGVNAISRNLYEKGLIKSKLNFETYVWMLEEEDDIIAATYEIPQNISIVNLTRLLVSGPVEPSEKEIQIIEGWNNREIAGYLEKEGVVGSEDFLKAVKEYTSAAKQKYDFLKDLPDGVDLEGYLFPDTYRIFKDASVNDILEKMLKNFDFQLSQELLDEIEKQGKTIHEVLTIASIIEKEVPSLKDRKMAADVFYKRLKIGMAMQSDATVNYVTGKGTTRPSLEDISVNSRYNTYQNHGLPPGPISNPSLDAILASIYPESNDYYYFLTTEDGEVIYSRTGAEHLRNKMEHLR